MRISVRDVGFAAVALFVMAGVVQSLHGQAVGAFENQSDVGAVEPAGTGGFDAARGVYTLTSAGENLWGRRDGFHFVWRRVEGNQALTAEIDFPVKSGAHNPHRKAVLIFRQSLDAGAAYADVAVHGVGLTALQYREQPNAVTDDFELNIELPRKVRLEKVGDRITMYVSRHGEPLHPVGASIRMHFEGAFYAGIGLCSHEAAQVEKAEFAHVMLERPAVAAAGEKPAVTSAIETISVGDEFRRVQILATEAAQYDAPIWSRDGKRILFTRNGKLATVAAEGGPVREFAIDAERCSGSHGFSPDGKWLAATCNKAGSHEAHIYLVPAEGGKARQLTQLPGAYFHSWSPDGKTILFTRMEPGGALNIHAIAATGGEERALTAGKGVSDDPDYSADGAWIYFNSDRAGGPMQIWRMRADGAGAEPVTRDERNNWTPHPSPDGKRLLMLSYAPEEKGHPGNRPVALRLLDLGTGALRTLIETTGGNGTDNVNNWAPDGEHMVWANFEVLPSMR